MKIQNLFRNNISYYSLKIYRIMKIGLFLCLIAIFQLKAEKTYSQIASISLSLKNSTIEHVLDQIEKETEFSFLLVDKSIDVKKLVDIETKDQPIETVLDVLFNNTDIQYRIMDRQIILFKREREQQVGIKVQGKVTDSRGTPIPGANVFMKGNASVGTVSDMEGKFTVIVPNENSTLTFSFIGFLPQDIALAGRKTINVMLYENTKELEEVVVVGYGTQKKSDLTGSIVSVKASDIKNIPANSVEEALQGKVAGVMINKTDGRPGAGSDIIIRGVGSINGLSPLFVIDGVARGGGVNYNLKDIESIEVIKDASAAAIYGAKAAGGVVLITTRKGAFNTKAQVDFSANIGVRSISNSYKMLETTDYIKARQAYGQDYAIWDNPSSLPNTNWMDELFHNGIEQNYNLSLTGGSEKIKYYLSTAYDRENGIQRENYWERISARLNVDYAVNNAITVGTRIYLARFRQNPFNVSIPWRTLPYMAVRNADGSFASVPTGVEFSGGNPVAEVYLKHIQNGSSMTDADLYLDWKIIDGLKFNVTGSAGLGSVFGDTFNEDNNLGRTSFKGNYTKSLSYGESYTLTTTLDYAKVFAEKHDFKVLIGYEAKNYYGVGVGATATDFPVNNPESFDLSTNDKKTASGSIGRDRFLSQFGRINYAFDNRYLLTLNIRRDGSPKFGPKNRWGVFPSASVGWKLHEESFFKNADLQWITSLKPRFSWGVLGNDAALGSFLFKPSYSSVTLHSFDESTSLSGYSNVKVINEEIKWESIYNTNAGLDVELLDNRLSLSFDYYIRKTKDMIYDLPTPLSAGITKNNQGAISMPVNIGRIDNKGWELLVSWRDHIGDFSYNLSANLSQNTNEVVDLGLPTAYIYAGSGYPFGAGGNLPFKTVNGEAIGMIWGLQTDGLISSQEELDELNAKARANGYDYYNRPLTGVGDLKFVDRDGNGKITNDDRTFIGNPWPKFIYGFNINLSYKGFDLTADFVGVAKRDVFNFPKTFEESFIDDYQSTYKIFNSSFFLGNGLTDQPRVVAVDPTTNSIVKDPNYNYIHYSDYFVEDASYLKLKNLTLGYTFPQRWTQKAAIQNLRVFVTGHNLITITNFSGLDPEFSGSKTSYGEYGIYTYPQTKMVSFGLNVSF